MLQLMVSWHSAVPGHSSEQRDRATGVLNGHIHSRRSRGKWAGGLMMAWQGAPWKTPALPTHWELW